MTSADARKREELPLGGSGLHLLVLHAHYDRSRGKLPFEAYVYREIHDDPRGIAANSRREYVVKRCAGDTREEAIGRALARLPK